LGQAEERRRGQARRGLPALARLYAALRLFVNFFQPSFKLAGKARDGAKVKKTYHPPATPYQTWFKRGLHAGGIERMMAP
jgi:hypothetical protein